MSVPLDRLYHYIEDVAKDTYGDNVVIYRFWPNGAKKLIDLVSARPEPKEYFLLPHVYCHDQEPLCYDFYELESQNFPETDFMKIKKASTGSLETVHHNLRWQFDVNNLALLVHSEKRSPEVKKYQSKNFIDVYYWNHAVLARDWFRYAEHLDQKKHIEKTFLIYNRAWSGTREYRLKFTQLLIDLGLQSHCKTTVNAVDPESNVHYSVHEFKNTAWQPNLVLENYFNPTQANSSASADFDISDYEKTHIEVVLETLFDDSRLHLTEKILRPMACGQPFILASTVGSLDYLRSYGFKTFDGVWDETYDTISNSQDRLQNIVNLMKSISQWDQNTLKSKMSQAQQIARFNKQHFFSKDFHDMILDEFSSNLSRAFDFYKSNNAYDIWINLWNQWLQIPSMQKWLKDRPGRLPLNLDYLLNLNQRLAK